MHLFFNFLRYVSSTVSMNWILKASSIVPIFLYILHILLCWSCSCSRSSAVAFLGIVGYNTGLGSLVHTVVARAV